MSSQPAVSDRAAAAIDTALWPPLLNCGLCRKLASAPVACPLQAIFCKSCLNRALADKCVCPTHRRVLRPRDIMALQDANRLLGKVWRHFRDLVDRAAPAAPAATGGGKRKQEAMATAEPLHAFGGFGPQVKRCRELVALPLQHPMLFRRLGVRPTRGVLLHGPPGTGKSLLAEALASGARCPVFAKSGSELLAGGNAAAALELLFKQATMRAPSLVFLDQLEVLAPPGEGAALPVVGALTRLMDALGRGSEESVVVIGATTSLAGVHSGLLRPGRFEQLVALGVPRDADRLAILRVHTAPMRLAGDVDLPAVAARLHGFVGADIAAVCADAGLRCLRANAVLDRLSEAGAALPAGVPVDTRALLAQLEVTQAHLLEAAAEAVPSCLRESLVQVPDVPWDAVGGLEPVKRELRELVDLPVQRPELFRRFGVQPPRGVLLYGPPGCGKTLLGRAVATQCQANFLAVKGPELLRRFVGESEAAVRRVFALARASAPCVLFFDELDALAARRGSGPRDGGERVGDNVLNTLLCELDGVDSDRAREQVFVIGASNRPDMIDTALLRPGRLDSLVLVPLPDAAGRRGVLAASLRNSPLAADVDLDALVPPTEGYSGADCTHLATLACKLAMREDAGAVRQAHLLEALAGSRASVPLNVRLFYDNFKLSQGGGAGGGAVAGGEEHATAEEAVDAAVGALGDEAPVSNEVREQLVAITAEWREREFAKAEELRRRLAAAEEELARLRWSA